LSRIYSAFKEQTVKDVKFKFYSQWNVSVSIVTPYGPKRNIMQMLMWIV
jgi:hypothetical protein